MRTVAGWVLALLLVVGAGVGTEAALGPSRMSSKAHAGPHHEAGPPGFSAAREQWIGSYITDGMALQYAPLALAIADLEAAGGMNAPATPSYLTAIRAIEDFERVPITGVTPALAAELRRDSAVLARFFDLPAMTTAPSCSMPRQSADNPAYEAWLTEPDGTSSGVRSAPLRRAAADLEQEMAADPAHTTCFPAAIADLDNLAASASPGLVASCARGDGGVYTRSLSGDETLYLGWFFMLLGGNNSVLASPCNPS